MPVVIPDLREGGLDLDQYMNSYKDYITDGDLFVGGIKEGFESTLVGAAIVTSSVERKARQAEQQLYGKSFIPWNERVADYGGMLEPATEEELERNIFMSKEEWQESEYYRDGLEYKEGLTAPRAKVFAETYDERKARKALYQKNANTFGRKALYFGANFIGNVLDPINLTVFGGLGAARTVSTAAMRGAVDNILTTAVADAAVFPMLNSLGDDLGGKELMIDIAFGGAAGAAFAGGGKAAMKYLEKTGIIKPKGEFPRSNVEDIGDIKTEIDSQINDQTIINALIPKKEEADLPSKEPEAFAEEAPKENWKSDGASTNLVVEGAEVEGDALSTLGDVIDEADIETDVITEQNEFFNSYDVKSVQERASVKAKKRARTESQRLANDVIKEDPLYRRVIEGKKKGLIDLDSLKGTYDQATINEIRKKHSGLIATKKNKRKIGIDELADELGMDADGLVNRLLDMDTPKQYRDKLSEEYFNDIMKGYSAEIETTVLDAMHKQFYRRSKSINKTSVVGKKVKRIKDIINGTVPQNPSSKEQQLAMMFKEKNLTPEQRKGMNNYIVDSVIAYKTGNANKISETVRPNGNLYESEFPDLLDATIGGYVNAVSAKGDAPISPRDARQSISKQDAATASKVTQKAYDDLAHGELPSVGEVVHSNPPPKFRDIEMDKNPDYSAAEDVLPPEYTQDLVDAESEYFNMVDDRTATDIEHEMGIVEPERTVIETLSIDEEGRVTRSAEDITDTLNTDTNSYMDIYARGADAAANCLYKG